MRLLLLTLVGFCLYGQPLKFTTAKAITPPASRDCVKAPCLGATNFPVDLYGPVDTRNLTWGHADAASLNITFSPPAGYRVKILRLRGDLVSWPKRQQQQDPCLGASDCPVYSPYDPTGTSGVLLGFSTTAMNGSVHADYMAEGCLLYIQDAVSGEPHRAPFDYADVDQLLEADSILVVTLSDWLNTTGVPIHMEETATITFQWVKE